MCIDIEDVDNSHPLWGQQGIDELDILEMFSVIDDVFGTNLFQNGYLDVFMFTIEDLYNLIEREANKLDTDALIAELESRGYVVKEE